MSQILHILRKDSRRFWPEILLSLAVNAACVAIYIRQWNPSSGEPEDILQRFLVLWITFLVPICWWLLIGRVVHAESLVGENQAWLTRPYDWKNLLTAKALFVAVYLYLPLLVAQCLVLKLTGFPPAVHSAELAYNLLPLSVLLVLPLLAIAAVTANLARMTLSLLGVLLAFVLLMLFEMWKREYLPTATAGYIGYARGSNLELPCALCLLAAVIIMQYATRRVWLTRGLLIAIPVACVIGGSIFSSAPNIDAAYPQPSGSARPIEIALDAKPKIPLSALGREHGNLVDLQIPVVVSGVAEGFAVDAQDMRFSIQAPDGRHWDTPWQGMYLDRFLPGSRKTTLRFTITRDLYRRVASTPVDFHLTFALTRLQAEPAATLPVSARDFTVPGFGICRVPPFGAPYHTPLEVDCRSALREPPLTYVSALMYNQGCPGSEHQPTSTEPAGAWTGSLDRDFAGPSISPVMSNAHFLMILRDDGERAAVSGRTELNLCPGTPISFTRYHLADRTRADFTFTGVSLPPQPTVPLK